MSQIKPTHKAIQAYCAALRKYADQHAEQEGALRSAFFSFLAETAKPNDWTLITRMRSIIQQFRMFRVDDRIEIAHKTESDGQLLEQSIPTTVPGYDPVDPDKIFRW